MTSIWPFKKWKICLVFEWNLKTGPVGIPTTVGIWNPTIWKPDRLKSNLQKVWISNIYGALAMAIALVPTIWKSDHLKSGHFCQDFKWFLIKGRYLSGFKMVGLPDFSWHLKSRPFATQPVLDHSKSRLGRISDPHCIFHPSISEQNIFQGINDDSMFGQDLSLSSVIWWIRSGTLICNLIVTPSCFSKTMDQNSIAN